jgi:DMSO/TMAO reductase YedYZ molybdopterin-dependent catalytic subunit
MDTSAATPPITDHDPADTISPREPSAASAALSGVLAAAAGLGVGELLASFVTAWPSPVVAVGDLVIANSPQPVVKWAIDTFGTNDKAVLIGGTLVILAAVAAWLGVVVQRRPGTALGGVAGFTVVAGYAAISGPSGGLGAVTPVVGVGLTAATVLLVLASGLANAPPEALPETTRAALEPVSRRRFLSLASIVVVGTAATVTAGRFLVSGFDVGAARAALRLPDPVESLDLPIPDDARVPVDGISDFVTSNDDFYRIDINLQLPQIDPDRHVVSVTGMVDQPLGIPFPDLLRRDLIDLPITMTCVSYEIGGELVGTAVWRGIRLRDLLDEAGVQDGADQIVGRSVDGYTCGFPLEAAYDRDAMLVVGMNGEPLPVEHGFPVRLITPGIYGYVGATKWLSEIEITRFDEFEQYWVPRGYDEQAPIKTMSRIDTPAALASLDPGEQVIAGVAWAQTRGIERVEVQIDDEAWQEATLSRAVNDVTWVQWHLPWEPTGGRHQLRVRATDGSGETQTADRAGIVPNGVSGQHSIPVTVRDT